jgi:hypothetical protein
MNLVDLEGVRRGDAYADRAAAIGTDRTRTAAYLETEKSMQARMREKTIRLPPEMWAELDTIAEKMGNAAISADPRNLRGRPATPSASVLRLVVERGIQSLRAEVDDPQGGAAPPAPISDAANLMALMDALKAQLQAQGGTQKAAARLPASMPLLPPAEGQGELFAGPAVIHGLARLPGVADGPRIDAGKLRAAVPGAERRKGSPERRDDAREEAPGRRLADELRTARESRGRLTQRAAAVAAGVPLSTYQRAEQGKDLRAENRDRLAAWAGAAG